MNRFDNQHTISANSTEKTDEDVPPSTSPRGSTTSRWLEPEQELMRFLPDLPAGEEALLSLAMGDIEMLHQATLTNNLEAAKCAAMQYMAICFRLNGNTLFGCRIGPSGGEYIVAMNCRAMPGKVPYWGQIGDFMITVNGTRTIVHAHKGFGGWNSIH
jgi:hypothetical protein